MRRSSDRSNFDLDWTDRVVTDYSMPTSYAEPLVAKFSRRAFLKLSGVTTTGLLLGVASGCDSWRSARGADGAFAPSAFVSITSDAITIFAPHPEIGQGVKTSLPMILAEELDASWEEVCVRQAPIDRRLYGPQEARGSQSIHRLWDPLRIAGATARVMLRYAAADILGLTPDNLCTVDGWVIETSGNRRVSYFELAESAANLSLPPKREVRLKKRSQYRLLGKRVSGVDNQPLVRGHALFGIDQQTPGMKVAVYEKCPNAGGQIRQANLDHIKALPRIVDAFAIDGSGDHDELLAGIAIVADDTWSALQARRQLVVDWEESRAANDSWSSAVRHAHSIVWDPEGEVVVDQGDAESAMARAATMVESFYMYKFVSHAQLEPQSCTAWYRNGTMEIWAATQTPAAAVRSVASVLGIPEGSIKLYQIRAGGAFGRRLVNDALCEAAIISRRIGKPIKLQWTREDDMAHDFHRAGGFHAVKGGLNGSGMLTAWQHHFITFTSDGEAPVPGGKWREREFPGELIDNFQVTESLLPWKSPCGLWRAPGSSVFGFVVQSFIHELAVAGARDHREFLLELLGGDRWIEEGNGWSLNTTRAKAVIERVTRKSDWGLSMENGRGLGLAFNFGSKGYFALVADVTQVAHHKFHVNRVVVVADVGMIVNQSGAENQVQGSVVDGLSTLAGLSITHENGRVQETNFHRYPILRMPKVPLIDVEFLESGSAPTGLGEPVLPAVAPAVCNAIFTCSGKRVRTLPISEEGVRLV